MSFSDDLNKFRDTVNDRTNAVFVGTVDLALESIQSGSPITAAPGQPVDTGVLRASWQKYFTSPTTAQISTNVEYAPFIEDGMNSHGPFKLRSAVGGFHSVSLTVAGFYRIVEYVRRQVSGNV